MVISLEATSGSPDIKHRHCFHLAWAKQRITRHRALTTELAHFQSPRRTGRQSSPKSPSIHVCLDRRATLITDDVATLLRCCDRQKYSGTMACPGTSLRGQSGRMHTGQNSTRKNFILGASYPVVGKGKETDEASCTLATKEASTRSRTEGSKKDMMFPGPRARGNNDLGEWPKDSLSPLKASAFTLGSQVAFHAPTPSFTTSQGFMDHKIARSPF